MSEQLKPQSQEGGDEGEAGNPFEKDYREFESINPDQISEEDVKAWADQQIRDAAQKKSQEERKKIEEKKTPQEKARESQEKMDEEWLKRHNLRQETFRKYKRIEAEIAPYLDDLSRLWRKIIFGFSKKMERGIEGYFKTGSELDVSKVIEEWPQIEKGNLEKVEIMNKMFPREVLIKKPELIRVRLVGDMSGSMNSEKIHILQQCFVLILSSLREFNTYLNLTRSQTKTKLEVDTEAWVFGSEAKKIKKFRSDDGGGEEGAEMVRIFENLENTLGGTEDDKPLNAILASLSPEESAKIKQEKIKDLVFEITDGGSNNPAATGAAVEALQAGGIIARAFQIGEVSDGEKNIFNSIWNAREGEMSGEIVGPDIKNLLPAMAELLKKYLGGVRL